MRLSHQLFDISVFLDSLSLKPLNGLLLKLVFSSPLFGKLFNIGLLILVLDLEIVKLGFQVGDDLLLIF